MKLARALRCCCGLDVVVGLAIFAGIVAAAVPAMADSASARRGAMAALMISLGNAQGGYMINVTLAGTGSGIVTDDFSQISCDADCTGTYSEGDVVTLTATENSGSYFTGWSGGGCSGTGPCVITVTDTNAMVTATFEANPTVHYTRSGTGSGSVMFQPAGNVCVLDCDMQFPPNTEVTMTASANMGSYFEGWQTGPCAGMTGPCTFTIGATDVFANARFTLNHEISVVFDGTGEGRVGFAPGMGLCLSTGGTCNEGFAPGTVVTLTATPDMGSFFVGWSGGGCTGTGPCEITMGTTQVAVTATFTLDPEFSILFSGTGTGQVTTQPGGVVCGGLFCDQRYSPGTELTLTATASPGSFFAGWFAGGPGGPMCSGTDPCSFTTGMFDASVTAQFQLNTPPVASCRDVTIDATTVCASLFIEASNVDDGSSDPDTDLGDEITLTLDFSGPFPIGQSLVTLTVTDLAGATSTCTATVTVLANDCNVNGIPDECDIGNSASLDCNNNGIPDECECFWCNVPAETVAGGKGPPRPDVNAQLSHLGGGTPCGEKVADDFYLQPGSMHRITAIRGKLLTNSNPNLLRARVELYEDCNGAPSAEPFFTADYNTPEDGAIPSEVVGEPVPADDGFVVVNYRFDLCDACIWLEGGKTYWVSIIGLTDNIDMVDLSYWVAGDERLPLLGSVPVKRSGTPGSTWGSCDFGPWESIEDCCIGCVNMDFCIDGFSCPILWDNGKVDLVDRGGSPSGAHRQYQDRTADNFVVKTCRDEDLCLIEAWIWTNCEPVHGFIELYEGAGCDPLLDDQPMYIQDKSADRAIWTGDSIDAQRFDETLVVNGRTHHLWRLRVKDPGLTLPAGRNYWVSAGAISTGNFNSNSFFAWSKYGCGPCNGVDTFRITPGQHRTLRPPATEWAEVIPARDFAFLIAVRSPIEIPQDDDVPPDDDAALPAPACLADANNDGNVGVEDIFAFLSAWFTGCP